MKKYKAFTLIELLVTITILAILWVIAFLAFKGYSQNSRDSVRVSDISKMKVSLEIFAIETWKYPIPSTATWITFSWWLLWNQWTFWESVFNNLEKLNKIPTDPLVDKEYTYSTTKNRRQYQIWGISEGDSLSKLKLINHSFAWNNIINALVVWNYNWFVSTSLSWTLCYILTVPSIIANDIQQSSDYLDIVNNKRLVFNWFQNIPDILKKTKYKTNWGFDFTPNNLIVYSDNNSCKILENDELLRINLLNDIKNSYSWTIIHSNPKYATLHSLIINTWALDANDNNITSLAWNIWRIVLGKKVPITYSMDNLMWRCLINWDYIENWNSVTLYSQNNIENSETFDCQSISQDRLCVNSTLEWENSFSFSSCVKWTPDSCSPTNFSFNSHYYWISYLLHSDFQIDIDSQYVSLENWKFTFKLDSISCNDWVYSNIIENTNKTLVSCDNWYVPSWNTCISAWTVNITSPTNIVCPFCTP